jgi:shikimate kinase
VLRDIAAQREPLYERVADITVEVADDPLSTFDLVIKALDRYAGTPAVIRGLLEDGNRVQG